jgi:hypothetical protein
VSPHRLFGTISMTDYPFTDTGDGLERDPRAIHVYNGSCNGVQGYRSRHYPIIVTQMSLPIGCSSTCSPVITRENNVNIGTPKQLGNKDNQQNSKLVYIAPTRNVVGYQYCWGEITIYNVNKQEVNDATSPFRQYPANQVIQIKTSPYHHITVWQNWIRFVLMTIISPENMWAHMLGIACVNMCVNIKYLL